MRAWMQPSANIMLRAAFVTCEKKKAKKQRILRGDDSSRVVLRVEINRASERARGLPWRALRSETQRVLLFRRRLVSGYVGAEREGAHEGEAVVDFARGDELDVSAQAGADQKPETLWAR